MKNKVFIYTLLIVLLLGAGAYMWLWPFSVTPNMVGSEMEEENEELVRENGEGEEFKGVVEDSDIPGWKIYYNEGLGFTLEVPEEFVVDELIDQYNRIVSFGHNKEGLQVRLREVELSFDKYFYLDTPLSATTTIDDRNARVFQAPNGYCDGPSCTPPFIAYAVKRNSTVYNLIFSGEVEISDLEKEILSTFKLI